jgi:hypothetical protein
MHPPVGENGHQWAFQVHACPKLEAPESARGLVSLYSRITFIPAVIRYSATQRELLPIVASVKHFRQYLWGHEFHIFTDYKALTFFFTQHVNLTVEQYIDTLLNYTFTISHCPGLNNVLPDALSCLVTRRSNPAPPPASVPRHVNTLKTWRTSAHRVPIDRTAWQLNPKVFHLVNQVKFFGV